ncbi:Bifunctional riboflavin kinase/FMN phosphatase [Includes: FMN phosphatase (FMN phosphohydrolase) [Durusdinium trenchii]|uniref:riboflavin kinase n=1 Tax=Durusdinium trenchii TaxID=1381693 RepID=A0ABP0R4L8_9DINO
MTWLIVLMFQVHGDFWFRQLWASFAVPAAPPPSPVPGRCEVISSISSPRYTPRTGLLRTSSPVTLSPRSSVGAGYAVGVAARSVGVLGTGPRPGLVPRLDLGKAEVASMTLNPYSSILGVYASQETLEAYQLADDDLGRLELWEVRFTFTHVCGPNGGTVLGLGFGTADARMEEVDILESESLAVCDAYDGEINVFGQQIQKEPRTTPSSGSCEEESITAMYDATQGLLRFTVESRRCRARARLGKTADYGLVDKQRSKDFDSGRTHGSQGFMKDIGSKELGFPTANLEIQEAEEATATSSGDQRALRHFAESHRTGIYCAFGSIEEGVGGEEVHPVAMSMGWNPTFEDVKAKTIEPWILHHFDEDFYDCHLRLLVVAYVRPEVKFESLEQLKAEIGKDGDFCRMSLEIPSLACFKEDPFLKPWTQKVQDMPGIITSAQLQEALSQLPPLLESHTRLFLTRHGETAANEQGVLCGGGHESELNQQGLKQAEELARELRECRFALVGSSSQLRARQSAQLLSAERNDVSTAEVLENLHEMRYGHLEGARIADVRSEMISIAESWRHGKLQERVGGVEGESPQDLIERVLASLGKVLRQNRGQNVLLVCHSWVNKALIAHVTPGLGLQKLLDVPQRNCAVNVLDYCCEGTDAGSFQVLAVDLVAQSRGAARF